MNGLMPRMPSNSHKFDFMFIPKVVPPPSVPKVVVPTVPKVVVPTVPEVIVPLSSSVPEVIVCATSPNVEFIITELNPEEKNMILKYDIIFENTLIQLPLTNITGDLSVDWGDNTPEGNKENLKHTYLSKGLYTLTISMTINNTTISWFGADAMTIGICFLQEVVSWGLFNTISLSKAFAYANKLTKVPLNFPKTVTDTSNMFYKAAIFQQENISEWDVAKVTNMRGMFYGAVKIPKTIINNWNISKDTNIEAMFQ
jgi:hypothetical protein